MILKIKNNRTKNETQGWRLIDQVKSVMFDRIPYKEFEVWKKQKINKNNYRGFFIGDKNQEGEEYSIIYVEYRDKTGEIFVTDYDAYILNDEGKTVEKIYSWRLTLRKQNNKRIDINEDFNNPESIEKSQRIYDIGTGKLRNKRDIK